MTYVADMYIFYTEPVRTELVGMAVFRGQEMNVEYINTQAPHQAEEKTPKSGMIDPACYFTLKSAGALLSNIYKYSSDYICVDTVCV